MFSEANIREIVETKIEKDEDLGERVGGSGHLGFTTYIIDKINKPEKIKDRNQESWKIKYIYTILLETEFTYYPDNPPYKYMYEKTIFVDDNGNIIREKPKKAINNPFDLKTDEE